MEIILWVAVSCYCIYLTFRLKETQQELSELSVDFDTLEIKVYNKMMAVRSEIRGLIKPPKRNEKSRRRSTKRSRKVSSTEIS